MQYGLALPQYDFSLAGSPVGWPELAGWAQRAEALGFNSVWLSDHLFYDLSRYGGPAGERKVVDCFTGLSALGACTTTVRLGALVVCNDLRNPAVLAKMAATVDVLSGGRFTLGLGAGWFEPEYRAAGIPFGSPAERVDRLSEAVRIIRSLLSEGEVKFDGRHYRLDGALCLPRPIQDPLPIFIGGRGDRVASLAGRLSDGFNSAWAWEPDDFADRVSIVNRSAERAGRDPLEVAKTVGLYALPARTQALAEQRWQRYTAAGPAGRPEHLSFPLWARDKLAGTYREIATKIDRFAQIGVTEIILSFGSIPFQVCDPDAVDEFMAEVVPLVG